MEVKYNNKIVSKENPIFLTTKETQTQPVVSLKGLDTNKYYTLILGDPDAVGGYYIHYLVTNITGNNINNGETVIHYYGPHPPEGSGDHHYIFTLYEHDKPIKTSLTNDPKNNGHGYAIELKDLLNQLGLNDKQKIDSTYFISNFQKGGKIKKKKRTKRKRIIKRRKTRSK